MFEWRFGKMMCASWSALLALGLASRPAAAAYDMYFQAPASKLAQDVYDMNIWMMLVCLAIFVVVFGIMFYSVIRHRKSSGRTPASFHESTAIEILWTAVPVVILVAIAWPVTKTLLAMRDSSNADITIKVTGYQWKWGYDYLNGEGEGIKFMSLLSTPVEQYRGNQPKGENYLQEVDHPLVVPVNRKIRILTTANDVIHSWYLPALAIKQDAMPGFIRDSWFRAEREGVFRGQCAELCGKDHGYMPIVVEVVSAEKYSAWVKQEQAKMAAAAGDQGKVLSLAELVKRGEAVYTANCAACHQADGKGLAGVFPPLDGAKIAGGEPQAHITTVLDGRPGTAMASFAKQLSDLDLAAVITYERNAWGNHTGQAIQATQIKAARH